MTKIQPTATHKITDTMESTFTATTVKRPKTSNISIRQSLKRRGIVSSFAISAYVSIGTALIWILFVTRVENFAEVVPVAIGTFLVFVPVNIFVSRTMKYRDEESVTIVCVLFNVIIFAILLGLGGEFAIFWILIFELFGVLIPSIIMGGILSIVVLGMLTLASFLAINFDLLHMSNDALTILGFSYGGTFLATIIYSYID